MSYAEMFTTAGIPERYHARKLSELVVHGTAQQQFAEQVIKFAAGEIPFGGLIVSGDSVAAVDVTVLTARGLVLGGMPVKCVTLNQLAYNAKGGTDWFEALYSFSGAVVIRRMADAGKSQDSSPLTPYERHTIEDMVIGRLENNLPVVMHWADDPERWWSRELVLQSRRFCVEISA